MRHRRRDGDGRRYRTEVRDDGLEIGLRVGVLHHTCQRRHGKYHIIRVAVGDGVEELVPHGGLVGLRAGAPRQHIRKHVTVRYVLQLQRDEVDTAG